MRNPTRKPLACVLGDMDLVRPLGLAKIPCAVAVPPGAPPRYSRFRHVTIEWVDSWKQPEQLVERLVRFASVQSAAPVLFYEEDGDLLVISRYRETLGEVFRFVVPASTLVEDLVDKARFQRLADRLSLPVPPGRCFFPGDELPASDVGVSFPAVVKPLTRRPTEWAPVAGGSKAVRVNSMAELRDLWPKVVAARLPVLVQQLIPGAETAIESYHVYVDQTGTVVAEFTGKKIRTYPEQFGDSTALLISNAADVVRLGRHLVGQLGLRGVAKLDFKRDVDGRLYLLEINPRFTLWHHPGALAGVNIPALVYSDLTGLPRPEVQPARPGVRWCRLWQDVHAAQAAHISFTRWLAWALTCDAKSAMAWDDPLPFFGAVMSRLLSRVPRLAGETTQ